MSSEQGRSKAGADKKPAQFKEGDTYLADIVLAFGGDGMPHNLLAADAEKGFTHLLQEFLYNHIHSLLIKYNYVELLNIKEQVIG